MRLKLALPIFFFAVNILCLGSSSLERKFRILSFETLLGSKDRKLIKDMLGSLAAFQHEKSMEAKYPEVLNLEKVINSFMEAKCVIYINNYQNAHMKSVTYPVLLRRPSLVAHFDVERPYAYKSLWGLENIDFEYAEDSENPWVNCYISKYLVTQNLTDTVSDLCIHLRLSEFVWFIKPWTCEVQIDLFPPAYCLTSPFDCSFPKLFHKKLRYGHPHHVTPSPIPPISILILLEHSVGNYPFDHFYVKKWVIQATHLGHARVPSTRSSSFANEIFIICKAIIQSNELPQNFVASSKIMGIKVLKLCPGCFHTEDPGSDFSSIQAISTSNLNILGDFGRLLTYAVPRSGDQLIWRFIHKGDEENVLDLVFRYIQSCDRLPKLSSRTPIRNSPTQRVGLAYAHVWRSIFQNYSITYGSATACNNDVLSRSAYPHGMYYNLKIILTRHPYVKGLYIFPTFIQQEITKLKFISCGKWGLSSVPYQELVSIFDKWIWFGIVASVFLWTAFLRYLTCGVGGLVHHWISLTKVLLEQGNPFRVPELLRVRFGVGIFLLMGTVLSSAYKNVNVYNMIAPRKPVPYEYLADLLADNFTLFTRTGRVDMVLNLRRVSNNISVESHLGQDGPINIIHAWSKFILKSEIASMISTWNEFQNNLFPGQNLMSRVAVENSSLVTSGIRNVAKLLDEAVHFITRILTNYPETDKAYQELTNGRGESFKRMELDMLFGVLEKCHKVALLLPEYICKRFATKLKTEKSLQHVYIGKESYTDIDWMFSFEGMVPPFLIRRFKSISESGIWGRWISLVIGGSSFQRVAGIQPITAANMQGNVVIIFRVSSYGLQLAFVCFFVEFLWGVREKHF